MARGGRAVAPGLGPGPAGDGAEEVAATVAFLASPAASGITGTTVPVDAGWSHVARLVTLASAGRVLLVTTPLWRGNNRTTTLGGPVVPARHRT